MIIQLTENQSGRIIPVNTDAILRVTDKDEYGRPFMFGGSHVILLDKTTLFIKEMQREIEEKILLYTHKHFEEPVWSTTLDMPSVFDELCRALKDTNCEMTIRPCGVKENEKDR
jgi:hypothetical protein